MVESGRGKVNDTGWDLPVSKNAKRPDWELLLDPGGELSTGNCNLFSRCQILQGEGLRFDCSAVCAKHTELRRMTQVPPEIWRHKALSQL
jgi:hypothetical protein